MRSRRTALLTIAGAIACVVCMMIWPDRETRLIKAVRRGDVRAVAGILTTKPELALLEEPHKAGSAPVLHLALSAGHKEIVRLLVSHGATPDKYPHALLLVRDTETARILVEHGADVNRLGNYGRAPLHFFAATDNVTMAEFLLDHGARVDMQNSQGEMPLHEAAREGCLSAAKLLIAKGADVDARSKEGRTPLECAALPVWNEDAHRITGERLRRCQAVGAYLVSCGSPWTIFELAWLGDIERLTAPLMGNPSLVTAQANGESLLFAAVRGGNADVVNYLLEHGAPVAVTGRFQQTPLQVAACLGHADVAEALLNHGADVNSRGPWGETALHWAVIRGNRDVAVTLLSHGADPNAQTSAQTVDLNTRANDADPVERELHRFQTRRRWRWYPGGVQFSFPPRLAFTTGDTPLHAAAYWNHPELVDLLIAHGADATQVDRWGNAALHVAVICGHADIAEKLLKAGADPQTRNRSGLPAIELARRIQNNELVRLLRRRPV